MSVPAALACICVLAALCIGEENWLSWKVAASAAAVFGVVALYVG